MVDRFSNSRCNRLVLALVICVLLAPLGRAAAEPPPRDSHPFVVTGVVKNSDSGDLIQRFVSILSARTGYPMYVISVDSYQALTDFLATVPGALGWTCGQPYVEDRRAYGQQLVAVPLFNGSPTYHSLVLARWDSTATHLSGFRNAVFAYSDTRSNSGMLAPTIALKRQGIDLQRHFRFLVRTGIHENTIKALLAGVADVAAVDEYVWVQYLKSHPEAAQRLKEVERFGPFPFTPVVAAASVPEAVVTALRKTLTEMNGDPEGKAVLDEFGLDGFVVKPPRFYAPIEAMLNRLNDG